jgi:hypothetical protein
MYIRLALLPEITLLPEATLPPGTCLAELSRLKVAKWSSHETAIEAGVS